ncbi:MAG: hypothetical protein ABR947_09790 [Solirubrobacteraceae bacterium]
MLRARLVGMVPFLSRWVAASSVTGCCGACPTCIAATAGSLLLPVLIRERRARSDAAA